MKHLRSALAAMVMAFALPGASAQPVDPSNAGEDAYVQGNLLFLTYHEVGHLVLDLLLDADQRGDRRAAEETADDIATWLMLPDPDEPDQDEEILAAMAGWLDSADQQDAPSQSPHYPDDAERAARIACYVYGSNPDLYRELGQLFSNAINSVDCEEETAALDADLHDWFGEHLIPPASPDGGRIRVLYEGPASSPARAYLMETRILEEAAEDIEQFIRLPSDVTLVARNCGAGAAEFRYNPATRRIIACYEAVDWFMGNASAELGERAASASGDELGSGGARVSRRPRSRPRP